MNGFDVVLVVKKQDFGQEWLMLFTLIKKQ
jgi:hypothetical protein